MIIPGYDLQVNRWKISDIKSSDWKEWGIASYGPTKKIILNGWNKKIATGPIESTGNNADFIWVIYRYNSPTKGSGITQMKLGAPIGNRVP